MKMELGKTETGPEVEVRSLRSDGSYAHQQGLPQVHRRRRLLHDVQVQKLVRQIDKTER